MNKALLFEELYKRYGAVTRARGCFLYTKKGVRLTDMSQEGGRAILGWDAGNAFTMFKNVLSRGQTGSFICEDKPRITKAVSTLFNSERTVLYFSSRTAALEAGLAISSEKTSFYRPWNLQNEKTNFQNIDCLVFEPPLPWTDSVFILAVKTEILTANPDLLLLVRGNIRLPFALECGITKSIYNLIKALQERQEKDWFIYDPVLTKYWNREGPYLFPKVPQEKYKEFVTHCLDCGIVISPDYVTPSIIPFGADKGVFTKLKNSPFEY